MSINIKNKLGGVFCLLCILATSGCFNSTSTDGGVAPTQKRTFSTPSPQSTPSSIVTNRPTSMSGTRVTEQISDTTSLQPDVRNTPTGSPSTTSTPILLESPPGWIAFVNNANSIDVIHTSGMGWRSIIKTVVFPESPTWSPDGQWLAFIGSPSRYADAQIYLARPDGSEIQQLTFTSGYINALSWSPDGHKIVFSQVNGPASQAEVELYVYDLDKPRIRQLTNTPGVHEQSPAYTPDGKSISFYSVQEDGVRFIRMTMDTNGSNVREDISGPSLPFDKYGVTPSSDGSLLAITTIGLGCANLYVINSDGRGLIRVSADSDYDSHPSWSPDGKWIAFEHAGCNASGIPFDAKIYLIQADGNGSKELIMNSTNEFQNPAWSPLPALEPDKGFKITELGAGLKLRSSPSLSGSVLGNLKSGDTISVLEGPEENDDYMWWRIRVSVNGLEGWIADNPGWFSSE